MDNILKHCTLEYEDIMTYLKKKRRQSRHKRTRSCGIDRVSESCDGEARSGRTVLLESSNILSIYIDETIV
jgi:hypothetical protein